MTVSASILDSFHSLLMDDDEFMGAVQRVALGVADDALRSGRHDVGHEPDDEDAYDLAMELVCRVSVA
jgi:hypothetical protein